MNERPTSALTSRERRVLRDIGEGLRNDDPALADELGANGGPRRVLSNPHFWAWLGAGAFLSIVGFLGAGIVVGAFAGFVAAVVALDRWAAATVSRLTTKSWTAVRTVLGFGPDAPDER